MSVKPFCIFAHDVRLTVIICSFVAHRTFYYSYSFVAHTQSALKISPRWTNDEIFLVVHAMRHYGKNFRAVADVIGTKTEVHVRSFFVQQRARYDLDTVLKNYERAHGGGGGVSNGDDSIDDVSKQHGDDVTTAEVAEEKVGTCTVY